MFCQRTIKIITKPLYRHVVPAGFHSTSGVLSKTDFINVNEENGIRNICLNEPKSLNSLSNAMMDSLHELIRKDKDDINLRCILITATGPVWSAGHNLKELIGSSTAEQAAIFSKLTDIINTMRKLPVPVLAKVDGLVAAGGLQLVSSCDLVICTERSKFAMPSGKFGIFPHEPIVALTRTMPRQKAFYMPIMGEPLDAEEAYIAGLVCKVAPTHELDNEVKKITDAITSKSRAVIALGKSFFYEQLEMSLEDAYKAAVPKMTENLAMPDGKEGVNSFLQKRKPVWLHK